MKDMVRTFLSALLCLMFSTGVHPATENSGKVVIYRIDIAKEIGSTTWIYTKKGFAEASRMHAKAIIIRLNTYGGEVVYADSIRTKILNSRIPVYAFIDNNAASAGALIAIACNKIFMREGASFGAATVVDMSGGQLPDKYQSYMRATIRATAEAHGADTIINGKDTIVKWKRDPHIAEAMVDNRIAIPQVVDSGRTLTFTTNEAIRHGYCDGKAENIDEIVTKYLRTGAYELKQYTPSGFDDFMGFLSSSILRGLLIMIIVAGIYFELQTPGFGVPAIAAIVAALLYFAPLYLSGSAEGWEILLFIIGIGLLALEIFVIPGFGIAGISGILCIISGLTLSMIDNINFDFSFVPGGEISVALLTVLLSITVAFAVSIYFSNKIGRKGIFRKVALDAEQITSEGFVGVPMEPVQLVGKEGRASTVLRPSGKVEIDGKLYDAVSERGFIEQDSVIKVTRYEAGQVYVTKG
jgi:membrane-bound serine protease (ClpP class)